MSRIVDLLKDEDSYVRAAAATTIGNLAEHSKPTVASTLVEETEFRGKSHFKKQ